MASATTTMATTTMANNNGDDDDGWCTIESDPGVFTSLVETLGVSNVEFTELWSLEDEALLQLVRPLNMNHLHGNANAVGDDNAMDGSAANAASAAKEAAAVYGLIFLFKWQSSSSNAQTKNVDVTNNDSTGRGVPLTEEEIPSSLYFARQMTHNACATQAILSVLFNASTVKEDDGINDSKNDAAANDDATATGGNQTNTGVGGGSNGHTLSLGELLTSFHSFTQYLPPDIRGEAIGSSDEIRTAHNSYGKPSDDAFLNDPSVKRPKRTAKDEDDVFHFIAYVPCQEDGCVYELDGLKGGPIRLGSYNSMGAAEDGTTTTTTTTTTATSNAITTMEWLRVARNAIQARLADYPMGEIKFNLMAMVQDRKSYYTNLLESFPAIDNNHNADVAADNLLSIREAIQLEEEKRHQWQIEKERRQFNYLPFCVQLLRSLAGCGKFEQLVKEARRRQKNSLEESRKRRRG